MKYVVFLLDGMADEVLPELGGMTPLEYARTPVMDKLASEAEFGTFLTLPEGFPTSSDVANMSLLGWDLSNSYTGRGPIESYGMGIPLDEETIAFRLNLITVKDGLLEDYSAGHIEDEEAEELITFLQQELGSEKIRFQKGVSYRHLLYLKGKEFSPHILYEKPDSSHGMEWEKILPKAADESAKYTEETLLSLMYRAHKLLSSHPINQRRRETGKNEANMIWPWSGGGKPDVPSFEEMYGKRGAIVAAVDVILGLGRLGNMTVRRPEGATGWIDTNYENKARTAVELLKDHDFVYVHLEAIDECGHLGDLDLKIRAIEEADSRLIGTFLELYRETFDGEPWRGVILPDHPVPVKLRKHTRTPVPFMLWGEGVRPNPLVKTYSERTALQGKYTGLKKDELMRLLFQ
ncbi:cofactor-independent phosphoglycerate mutase [Thermospira aquatica]|uniref:Cofactor-independent phosphoglycerate mutase n=1 Tax=Thermospira aquatica TaxID=2828656 RepID=A0AAX3BDS8_9SPIR|nr:cofactor-independent phosphoglycerate mutase [Thermospira aquatica]URA10484.1 cofactor-independent phosphoglycerate mutase [Thermospira aquatica]